MNFNFYGKVVGIAGLACVMWDIYNNTVNWLTIVQGLSSIFLLLHKD